ncbi:hypothetical protein [Thermoactinospora rubra]|uniref:hypothetical protein n=1 Tax=Thermoactinospora rubra TaxID=1088767 RepID=UPI000A10E3D9|nr:hypothetical protein [Thermoactinospora rubra]
MRRTAGVLSVALTAVALSAAPAVAAGDCDRGQGVLSGLTDRLCDLVDDVTDTVDAVTGDSLGPVTDTADKAVQGVNETVGKVAPTPTRQPPSQRGEPTPTPSGLLPSVLEEVCLPGLACEGEGVLDGVVGRTPAPTARPAKPRPRPSGSPTPREESLLPTEAPRPPRREPHLIDTGERVLAEPAQRAADTDLPRLDLLWPNPFAERLEGPMTGQDVVRPSERGPDVLGTALTAALLASAVLATRIVQQRRRREEDSASIPFQPVRAGGRHRLAGL